MSAQPQPIQEQPPGERQDLRFCPRCAAMIPIREFGINRQRPDGLNRYCRPHALQQVHEFRARCKAYRAAARQRRQASLKGAFVVECIPGTDTPLSALYRVLTYLQKHDASTQKELSGALKLSLNDVDIALTELLITRRLIGTRVLDLHRRIYFCL